jgi:uncharacterized membrane protein YtjA (UPF0391 family)
MFRHIRTVAKMTVVYRLQLESAVRNPHPGGEKMLHWSLMFLVIALIAAVLGFGGLAGTAIGIAKILFFVFLVLWLVAFLLGRRAV